MLEDLAKLPKLYLAVQILLSGGVLLHSRCRPEDRVAISGSAFRGRGVVASEEQRQRAISHQVHLSLFRSNSSSILSVIRSSTEISEK